MVSVVCEVWTQVTKKHVQPDSHPLRLRKRLRSVKRTVTLWHRQECTAVTKRRPHSRHHRALGCRPRCVHRRHSQVQTEMRGVAHAASGSARSPSLSWFRDGNVGPKAAQGPRGVRGTGYKPSGRFMLPETKSAWGQSPASWERAPRLPPLLLHSLQRGGWRGGNLCLPRWLVGIFHGASSGGRDSRPPSHRPVLGRLFRTPGGKRPVAGAPGREDTVGLWRTTSYVS